MRILIKNADLISMDEKREQIEKNVDILIDNSQIKRIERDIKCEADNVIDASRKNCYARIN